MYSIEKGPGSICFIQRLRMANINVAHFHDGEAAQALAWMEDPDFAWDYAELDGVVDPSGCPRRVEGRDEVFKLVLDRAIDEYPGAREVHARYLDRCRMFLEMATVRGSARTLPMQTWRGAPAFPGAADLVAWILGQDFDPHVKAAKVHQALCLVDTAMDMALARVYLSARRVWEEIYADILARGEEALNESREGSRVS